MKSCVLNYSRIPTLISIFDTYVNPQLCTCMHICSDLFGRESRTRMVKTSVSLKSSLAIDFTWLGSIREGLIKKHIFPFKEIMGYTRRNLACNGMRPHHSVTEHVFTQQQQSTIIINVTFVI